MTPPSFSDSRDKSRVRVSSHFEKGSEVWVEGVVASSFALAHGGQSRTSYKHNEGSTAPNHHTVRVIGECWTNMIMIVMSSFMS